MYLSHSYGDQTFHLPVPFNFLIEFRLYLPQVYCGFRNNLRIQCLINFEFNATHTPDNLCGRPDLSHYQCLFFLQLFNQPLLITINSIFDNRFKYSNNDSWQRKLINLAQTPTTFLDCERTATPVCFSA